MRVTAPALTEKRTYPSNEIEKARGATLMPWPEREARMWQIAFPQMTNWLPPDEGDQLRFEFAQEMQRLAKAA
jgi:hypothetical protein